MIKKPQNTRAKNTASRQAPRKVKSARKRAVTKLQKNVNFFKRPPKLKKVFLYITLSAAALVTLVWVHVQIDIVSKRIGDLEEEMNMLENMNHHEQQELDKLSSYEKVFDVVNPKFGMALSKQEPTILVVPRVLVSAKQKND